MSYRSLILRTLKRNGQLHVESLGMAALESFLSNASNDETESIEILEKLIKYMKEKGINNPVPLSCINAAIVDLESVMSMQEDETVLNMTTFVPAFSDEWKSFKYNQVRQGFVEAGNGEILSASDKKREIWVKRYDIIRQRLLRDAMFSSKTVHRESQTYTLSPLSSLVDGRHVCFGMISHRETWVLEDPISCLEIVLDMERIQDTRTSGFFTENCFVIVEGEMSGGKLFVETIGHPPAETRATTLNTFPILGPITAASIVGNGSPDDRMVIISDLRLDLGSSNRLRVLREVASKLDPATFILCGNFGLGDINHVAEYFESLADVFPSSSTVVLIPGPQDMCCNTCLPRSPLLDLTAGSLKSKGFILGTSPMRIKYWNKEIVVHREDIMNKMRRNCIFPPSLHETDLLADHLAKTLLDQCTLSPLPLGLSPIHWGYEHALQLYPAPDCLILADSVQHYRTSYRDCEVINPGSFYVANEFTVYYPFTNVTEYCAVPSFVDEAEDTAQKENIPVSRVRKEKKKVATKKVKEVKDVSNNNNTKKSANSTSGIAGFFRRVTESNVGESIENNDDDTVDLIEDNEVLEDADKSDDEELFQQSVGRSFVADESDVHKHDVADLLEAKEVREQLRADLIIEEEERKIEPDFIDEIQDEESDDEQYENFGKQIRGTL